ncbi:MAG: hypothetical protein QE278_14015 [Limnobacter sp.]|nr:hypothetical protein [Limnobacter sp.]
MIVNNQNAGVARETAAGSDASIPSNLEIPSKICKSLTQIACYTLGGGFFGAIAGTVISKMTHQTIGSVPSHVLMGTATGSVGGALLCSLYQLSQCCQAGDDSGAPSTAQNMLVSRIATLRENDSPA